MNRAPLLLLMAFATCFPETLTRSERDYAMSQLHATRKMFLDALEGLSDSQWRFKPSADRWSIAECAEHVLLSEDFFFQRVQQLLKSPPQPERKPAKEDHRVYLEGVDRSQKRKVSEPALQPKGAWASPEQLAREFKQRRDRIIAYVESTQDPLRAHFDGSGPEALDAYQWIIRLAAHTERHVAQIEEIKASPRYPRQ